MLHRFEDFVTGITECYRYIQRIKAMEMTELGLKGTHVMCLFYLGRSPEGLTSTQLCTLCGEDKAAVSRTLAELEQLGHCHRLNNGKKYRALLKLTPEGARLAEQICKKADSVMEYAGQGLFFARISFTATFDCESPVISAISS